MAVVKKSDISICNWKHMKSNYVISVFAVMERNGTPSQVSQKDRKHYKIINMENMLKRAGKVFVEPCCAEAYFPHLVRGGLEKIDPFLFCSLNSTHMTK